MKAWLVFRLMDFILLTLYVFLLSKQTVQITYDSLKTRNETETGIFPLD